MLDVFGLRIGLDASKRSARTQQCFLRTIPTPHWREDQVKMVAGSKGIKIIFEKDVLAYPSGRRQSKGANVGDCSNFRKPHAPINLCVGSKSCPRGGTMDVCWAKPCPVAEVGPAPGFPGVASGQVTGPRWGMRRTRNSAVKRHVATLKGGSSFGAVPTVQELATLRSFGPMGPAGLEVTRG